MPTLDQLRNWIGDHDFISPVDQVSIQSFAVDSRRVTSNALYFALAGESANSRNGHEFLFQAAAAGAVLFCIERSFKGPVPPKAGIFKVVDCLASLQKLAHHYLMHCRAKVIAITGSIGKTTTTQYLGQIANPYLELAYTKGSQNTRIGVPLTILNNLRPHHKWIALEMGMDRAGQLSRLVKIAPPSIAVITAIELAHMENFATLDEIASAKGEILLPPSVEVALINRDSNCHQKLKKMGRCDKKLFSTRISAVDFAIHRKKNRVRFFEKGQMMMQLNSLSTLAPQHLSCLIAAVGVASQLLIPHEEIALRCSALTPPKGRFCRVRRGDFTLIDDSYNASPASVLASLTALPLPEKGGRRLAVLAPMEELGCCSEQEHLKVGRAAFLHLDGVICLDPMGELIASQWRSDSKPLWRAGNLDEIFDILRAELSASDVLLVKGSRKWELEKIVARILKDLLPSEP